MVNPKQLHAKAKEARDRLLQAEEAEGLSFWESLRPGAGLIISIAADPVKIVDDLAKNDPAGLNAAIATMRNVTEQDSDGAPFSALQTQQATMVRTLSDAKWSGKAATSFRENVLDQYESIRDVQVQVVDNLGGTLQTHQTSIMDSYSALDRVLDGVIKSSQAIIDKKAEQQKNRVSQVASGAVALMASPNKLGAALSAAQSVIGLISNEIMIGGETVDEICASLKEAHKTLSTNMKAVDHGLRSIVQDDMEMIGKSMSSANKNSLMIPFEIPGPTVVGDMSTL